MNYKWGTEMHIFLELLFFAVIAFFTILKLIAMLGEKDEDGIIDKANKTVPKDSSRVVLAEELADIDLNKDNIESGQLSNVLVGLGQISQKLSTFDFAKFYSNSQKVFKILVQAARHFDHNTIEDLVDSKYTNKFQKNAKNYNNLFDLSKLEAKVIDAYALGNNLSITLLFKIGNDFAEEWTFFKSATDNSPKWNLSNIEQA